MEEEKEDDGWMDEGGGINMTSRKVRERTRASNASNIAMSILARLGGPLGRPVGHVSVLGASGEGLLERVDVPRVGLLGGCRWPLGGILGASWGLLGASLGLLGGNRSWKGGRNQRRPSGAPKSPIGDLSGSSWGALGRYWGRLGTILGPLGGSPGPSRNILRFRKAVGNEQASKQTPLISW
eukprot:9467522-Pyramimonas_sp.AAC.1